MARAERGDEFSIFDFGFSISGGIAGIVSAFIGVICGSTQVVYRLHPW
jgi:hypothetical protein